MTGKEWTTGITGLWKPSFRCPLFPSLRSKCDGRTLYVKISFSFCSHQLNCTRYYWRNGTLSIVGAIFRWHYIIFPSRPKAHVHELLQSQQYKPLPDGEGVQPLSLLFHEQRSEVKLQPSTRIANKKNKSGILYWIMNTSNEKEYFYMQPGLSYLRYELR